uniref:periphilin-1 isoform X2 n=1 Tax=Myxine glutinosa TaxID=7769 RepID=UPI00358EDE6C
MYARGWDRPGRSFQLPHRYLSRPVQSWEHADEFVEKEEMMAELDEENWRLQKQWFLSQERSWQDEQWRDHPHYSPRCSPDNSERYENHWRGSHVERKPRGQAYWRQETQRAFDLYVDNVEDEDSTLYRRRVQPVPPLRCEEREMPRSPTPPPRNQQSVHPPYVSDRGVKRTLLTMPEMELAEHSAQMAVDEMPSYPYRERGLTSVNKNLKWASPHLNEVRRGSSHDSDKEPGSQPTKIQKKSSESDQAMESQVKQPEPKEKALGVPVMASGDKTTVESPGHGGTYRTRPNLLELYNDADCETKRSSGTPKSISPRPYSQIPSRGTCVQDRSPNATAWRAPLGPDCGKEEDMMMGENEAKLNKDDVMKRISMQTAMEAQLLDNMMESAHAVEFDEACENRIDGHDKRSQAIVAKKLEIEQAFKQDCRTTVAVVKMLVRSAPELEGMVGPALRGSLQHLAQRCLQQMQEFVYNFNSANNQANV